MFVSDLRHFIDMPEDALGPARKMADHLGSIVKAATATKTGTAWETALPCRRRPGNRPCPGHIVVFRPDLPATIDWRCSSCDDEGVISGWAGSYFDLRRRLLEDLFLVQRLPAWGKTLRARAASSPKIHVVDSGLAARLLRLSPAKLRTLDPTALAEFGNLLETFVVNELLKQVTWLDQPVTVGHWRTYDGDEVDFVVEDDEGRVLAIEVKSGDRVPAAQLSGLAS